MAPSRVVQALDELEGRHPGLGLGLEFSAIEQLVFKGGEEALAHRIVASITDQSHRRPDTGFLASQAEGDRGVMRSLIGLMDHIDGAPLRQRHDELQKTCSRISR